MGTVSHKLKSGEMVKLTAPGIGPIYLTAGVDQGGGGGRFFKLVTHLPDEVTLHRNPKNPIDAKRWPGGAPVNMQRMTKDGIDQREQAKASRDQNQAEANERRQALISGTLAEYNHAIKNDDLDAYRNAMNTDTIEAYRKKIADEQEPEEPQKTEPEGGDKTGANDKTPPKGEGSKTGDKPQGGSSDKQEPDSSSKGAGSK